MSHSLALSRVELPVTVPLAPLTEAANRRLPQTFAQIDEQRNFLGGLMPVRVTGQVVRSGAVGIGPAGADSLRVTVPIRADFRAEPLGLGGALAQPFGGSAVIELLLRPQVSADWQVGLEVKGDYRWTDPLALDLGQGVKISVQSLADAQVRAQLDALARQLSQTVSREANLRERAGKLWARVQQPWPLPLPHPAYALVQPRSVTLSPLELSSQALTLNAAATFDLQAALGRPPQVKSMPLAPLQLAPAAHSGIELKVPVRLPYAELSALATRSAAGQEITLPLPLSPKLRVLDIQVTPRGERLNAAVTAVVTGPLGLRVRATSDVSGVPSIDQSGVLRLSGVQVRTRPQGLSGKVIGWLADARAQAFLAQSAHFDLKPVLAGLRRDAQARLPYTPHKGVQIGGQLGTLSVQNMKVMPDALSAEAVADGQLQVELDARQF